MSYCINLGNWNSVFAVPSCIVDKHIKLAGALQLKVLLWILRHSGENFSLSDIAKSFSMHETDIKDALQYWIETNIIRLDENSINPGNREVISNTTSMEDNIKEEKQNKVTDKENNIRPISRHQKPDSVHIASRMKESQEISSLMQEAQIVLGRPISNSDCAILLMLHDNDGLPIDVIIMLMQYAVSIGKGSMKYIEKVGISWAEQEIDTLEKAEEKIKNLSKSWEAWSKFERIIGIQHRSPTSKEEEAVCRWMYSWKFSEDMIKEAYERCVNANGKYILKYIDSIIERWRKQGITTIQQALSERMGMKKNKNIRAEKSTPSYNIDEYENYSIFDDVLEAKA